MTGPERRGPERRGPERRGRRGGGTDLQERSARGKKGEVIGRREEKRGRDRRGKKGDIKIKQCSFEGGNWRTI